MPQLTVNGTGNIVTPGFYIPNRLSPEALRELHALLGGKVCYLSDRSCPPSASLRQVLGQLSAEEEQFEMRRSTPLQVREQVQRKLRDGKSVLYVPGEVARIRGTVADLPAPYLISLGNMHISPIPVFLGHYGNTMDTLIGDRAEQAGGRQKLDILPKLAPGPQAGARLLAAWLNCSAEQFGELPFLQGSMTTQLLRAMHANPKVEVIDGMTGAAQPNERLLGVAMAYARRLRKLGEPRIGVILPPGPGAVIATMACMLAGCTPVMINYAASRESFESARGQAGLNRFISARAFQAKLPSFSWPAEGDMLFLEDELKALGKLNIIAHVLMARTLPAGALCRMYSTNARHGDDEAVMLFTSGSAGEPKGVALSHRMLLTNMAQSVCRITFTEERFLGSLPIFHSFGLTITMMLPLLTGYTLCTYPNPTDARRLTELVKKYRLTMLCATPTFARAMLRRADDDTFSSVRHFILGAEKLPRDLAEEFRARTGVSLLEGYGLTEAAPVCATNLPDAPRLEHTPFYVPASVEGSVGAPLPGIAVRITDVDDDTRELPITEMGMLWFKGPNFFKGYVGRPELNPNLFKDGWFRSGDLGRMDLNGFIFLGGRLSRFSKIGGEMVPHEAVEQATAAALDISANEDGGLTLCVTGVPDAQKGEALALLTSRAEHETEAGRSEAQERIRAAFVERSIPNLWVPRHIIPVEQIPVLPTGKLDIRRCKLLACEALGLDAEG